MGRTKDDVQFNGPMIKRSENLKWSDRMIYGLWIHAVHDRDNIDPQKSVQAIVDLAVDAKWLASGLVPLPVPAYTRYSSSSSSSSSSFFFFVICLFFSSSSFQEAEPLPVGFFVNAGRVNIAQVTNSLVTCRWALMLPSLHIINWRGTKALNNKGAV